MTKKELEKIGLTYVGEVYNGHKPRPKRFFIPSIGESDEYVDIDISGSTEEVMTEIFKQLYGIAFSKGIEYGRDVFKKDIIAIIKRT